MSSNQWLSEAIQQLTQAQISSPQLDAELLLAYVLEVTREQLLLRGDVELSENQLQKLQDILLRRSQHEPMAYIRRYTEFYGRTFAVTQSVLVPRPETERLCEMVNSDTTRSTILELGTGSGVIGITVALENPETSVVMTDISQDAVDLAARNAAKLGATVKVIQSNMFQNVTGTHDAIAANLPYLPTARPADKSISREPAEALFSGVDGLNHYRILFQEAHAYLNDRGVLYIEAEPQQEKLLVAIAKNYGYTLSHRSDYAYKFLQTP